MIILEKKMTKEEILKIDEFPNGFVKGVVDVEKKLIALNADMHYELSDYLVEEVASKEENLWGFNLWLNNEGIENILEYDSMINIHNNQIHGFPRGGMNIMDPDIEAQCTEVIKKWIEF